MALGVSASARGGVATSAPAPRRRRRQGAIALLEDAQRLAVAVEGADVHVGLPGPHRARFAAGFEIRVHQGAEILVAALAGAPEALEPLEHGRRRADRSPHPAGAGIPRL